MNRTYPSGMVRGEDGGKVNFLLVRDGPMLERWARLLTEQAPDKGKRNWMQAHTQDDLDRFLESADRHMAQWQRGDDDEDHAASILFNVNGAEFVRARMTSTEAFKDVLLSTAGMCSARALGTRCVRPAGHQGSHVAPAGRRGSLKWEFS